MEQQPKIPTAINALIVLGVIGPFIVVALFSGLIALYVLSTAKHQTAALPGNPATLGELGSRCGGPNLLPCKPGTVCSVGEEQWQTTYGECITDPSPPRTPGVAGSVCDAENGCGPGLNCDRGANATGTCKQIVIPDTQPGKPAK
jgi:hypothetical protein